MTQSLTRILSARNGCRVFSSSLYRTRSILLRISWIIRVKSPWYIYTTIHCGYSEQWEYLLTTNLLIYGIIKRKQTPFALVISYHCPRWYPHTKSYWNFVSCGASRERSIHERTGQYMRGFRMIRLNVVSLGKRLLSKGSALEPARYFTIITDFEKQLHNIEVIVFECGLLQSNIFPGSIKSRAVLIPKPHH